MANQSLVAQDGVALTSVSINAQTGTAYTLALTDAPATNAYTGIVTLNNAAAVTVTIPTHATVAFPIGTQIQLVQLGAGQVSVVGAAGVTVSNPSSNTARAQYATVGVVQVATDVWVLGGDLT